MIGPRFKRPPSSLNMAAALVIVAALCGLAAGAEAHNRSESFSSWEINGATVRATFTVLEREATRIPFTGAVKPDLGVHLAGYLYDHLGASAGGVACP